MIELLVVISIIAVMVAILLPSLSSAREQARRVHCASNLRQLHIGMEMYADDYKGHYAHGSTIYFHRMSPKKAFREEYMNGSYVTFYCPSADYRYNHKAPQGPRSDAYNDAYFGYFYWGGTGRGYAGHKWLRTASRQVTMDKGNPSERAIFMDSALDGTGKTRMRQEQASRGAMPTNNHIHENPTVSVYENVAFLDGHTEGFRDPPERTRRLYYWRWGNVRW